MKTDFPLAGFWLSSSWFADRRVSDPRPIACRTGFTLQKNDRLQLRISSCEYYALFINGTYIGHGPARSYHANKVYDELDISSFCHPGENSLALLVTIPTGEVSHRGRLSWWCDCHNQNGDLIFKTEPNSWLCRIAGWYDDFCEPRSLSSARQEHIYAEKEERNWKTLPLTCLAKDWVMPFELGPVDWTPPFRKLRRRETGMQKRMDLPLTVAGSYTAEPALFPLKTLADNFNSLTFSPAGKTFDGKLRAGEVYTFDLGKTRTFIPVIKVIRGNRHIRLESFCDTRHFDRPQATSPLESAGAGFADTCFLSDDCGQEFIPIVPYGGRFWSLRAAGSGECEVSLRLQSLEYPYPESNRFASTDEELEKFMDIADATVRSATQEVFVDTCWREQALWTRDAAISGLSAFYLFGDSAVWKESLRLIGEGISDDGVPCAVVPAELSHLALTDQTFSWINSLEDYFMISGDRKFIREMRPGVMRFLRLMRRHTGDDGLFAPPQWSWHFIDWAQVDRRPWSLTVNAMLYSALVSAHKLYGDKFTREFAELSKSGVMKFWDEEKGYFVNHLDGAEPDLGNTVFFLPEKNYPDALPVHGNALLLDRELFPAEYCRSAAEKLAGWLLPAEKSIEKFGCSWFGTVIGALLKHAQHRTAWQLIRERCGTAVANNAPTYGEMFPFREFNSAHGWSSSVAELLSARIWGLKPIEPGFRKITLAPVSGMPDSELLLHTPGGKLHLRTKNGKLQIITAEMSIVTPS